MPEKRSSVQALLPGTALIGSLVALAFLIHSWIPAVSPLAMAVALGFVLVNVGWWPTSAEPAAAIASKRIMRIGVALLGLQLSLSALAEIGLSGVITVFAVVTCTVLGILGLSRLFRMSGDLGLLIGIGFGICGATAVAAVRPQTRATQEETSYAIALIALCGTASIIVLPLISAWLGLSDATFGAWVGAAVHDVGQVVATASIVGDEALQAAIVVKLARVTMLAPIVIALSVRHRRYLQRANVDPSAPRATVPWIPGFVLGFLAIVALNSTGVLPDSVVDAGVTLSKVCLAAGLVALGAGVRWAAIRAIGARPMAMGLLAWVLVGGIALGVVTLTGL